MKLAIVNDKLIGEKVAIPIYNANGIMFINQGVSLTPELIKKMRTMGIGTLYIETDNKSIVLHETIGASVKIKIMQALKKEFINVKERKKINSDSLTKIAEELISEINFSENAFFYNNIGNLDQETALVAHCIDVAIKSVIIGVAKKYDYKHLQSLCIGALLHDVGKMIPDFQDHTIEGYRYIKENSSIPATASIIIYQHNEKINGTGPKKIPGEKLTDFSKIVSICDAYVNLLNESNLPDKALEEIIALTHIRYDRDIVNLFLNSIYCYPNGLDVCLNNGLKGTVAIQNKHFPSRPLIKISDSDANYINLIKDLTIFVEKVII